MRRYRPRPGGLDVVAAGVVVYRLAVRAARLMVERSLHRRRLGWDRIRLHQMAAGCEAQIQL